jgi:pimeloyl-ACP methyl ester carboxylesterase
MGGNEITGIAGSHPERVGKIVYLDAAYDWADPAFAAALQKWPLTLAPPAEAHTSLESFRQWHRATWFPGVVDSNRVEAYIRGLVDLEPDGSVRPLMSDSVTGLVYAALLANHRAYRNVKVPALAIYATTFVDTVNGDSARRARTRGWEEKYMRLFRAMSMARITAEIPKVKTLSVPGTHADFLFASRDQVASAIITFLADR